MYHYARRNGLFFWQYALWILTEIFAMSMFYTLFQNIVLDDQRLFSDMLRQSIINTSLVLLLPYSILWLYFALKDRNKKLATLSNKEMEEGHSGKQMFNFRDEKKELRFSVVGNEVLWIEAADNYAKIYYQNKGKIATFMIRNTLKKIENDFTATSLVRCNRSVIVNFDRIKILRKEQEGIFLSLDYESAPDILVSKTYADKVLMRFSEQYSG